MHQKLTHWQQGNTFGVQCPPLDDRSSQASEVKPEFDSGLKAHRGFGLSGCIVISEF